MFCIFISFSHVEGLSVQIEKYSVSLRCETTQVLYVLVEWWCTPLRTFKCTLPWPPAREHGEQRRRIYLFADTVYETSDSQWENDERWLRWLIHFSNGIPWRTVGLVVMSRTLPNMWFNLNPNYRFNCISESMRVWTQTRKSLLNIFASSRSLIRNELNLSWRTLGTTARPARLIACPSATTRRTLTYNNTVDTRAERIAEFRLPYWRRQQCIKRSFTQTFQ